MTEVFVVVTHDNRFVGVHATEHAAQRETEWMGRSLHISREELSDAPGSSSSLSLSQIDWLRCAALSTANSATAPASEVVQAHEIVATLDALRAELTEDDGG